MTSSFLCTLGANIIFVIHLLVVLFVIFAPFFAKGPLLILTAVFLPTLLIHWSANDSSCCLTLAESWLRGCEKDQTFLEKIMGPIYILPPEHKSWVFWLTVALWILTIWRLYKNKDELKNFWTDVKMAYSGMFGGQQ